MRRKILVTGGSGFIGTTVVECLLKRGDCAVVNADKLTYASVTDGAAPILVGDASQYQFERVDVSDAEAIGQVIALHRPDAVLHLAAETHVDRSLDSPATCVQANVVGTFVLLEAALAYWHGLSADKRARFRLHCVSTDEVFGSLGDSGSFSEATRYDPRSPYSASKAASDHFARAWHHTFGLPVIVTNCSNNYGPRQFPEKLIPLCIIRALNGQPIRVYGRGENVRDWLYVYDHAEALLAALERGRVGETYNIGGRTERRNIDVVRAICDLLDVMAPDSPCRPHRQLITFVEDRLGHDFRYAIDCSKIERELAWRPKVDFEEGLRRTVAWYLENRAWWQDILDRRYGGERLGLHRNRDAK